MSAKLLEEVAGENLPDETRRPENDQVKVSGSGGHGGQGWIPKASVSPVGAAAVNRARHQRQAIREASRGASDGKRRAFPEPAIAVPVCGHNNL